MADGDPRSYLWYCGPLIRKGVLVRSLVSLLLIPVAALVGCSAKPHLSLQDRAMATGELIAVRPACAVFSRQLADPAADEKSILGTYQAAKAASCIKPDV